MGYGMKKLMYLMLWISLGLVGCQKTSEDRAIKSIDKGNKAFKIKDYRRAIQFYNAALDQEPTEIRARLGLTKTWLSLAYISDRVQTHLLDSAYNQAGFWKRAAELNGEAFFKTKGNVFLYNKVHLSYAQQLFVEGLYSKALSLLNETTSIEKDSVLYLDYLQLASFVHFSKSQDSLALDKGRQLIELYPDFEPAYLDVGKMYWQVEDYEEALVVWSVGQERFPKNEELSYWVLEAMDKTGWLDD